MPSALWPHLRALLVMTHIIAVVAAAFPSPSGGMQRSAWKDPTVQAEFEAWADRLSMDQADLESHLWEIATRAMSVRTTVLKPFQPYYDHLGTYQTWHMFVAPHRNPAKLYIDVQTGAGLAEASWELVYISRDPQLRWQAPLMDHSRARAALFRYSWKHYRSPYRKFGQWLARQAATDFPDATHLRLRWFRYRTPTPRQVQTDRVPEGKFERELRYTLEDLR